MQRFTDLDLADQVQGRSQGGFAFFPLGWANFAWVSSNVLSSLDLAQQLGSVTANTAVVQFNDLDLTFRVDHEGATVSQASFFDQHVEVAGDGRVGSPIMVYWILPMAGEVLCQAAWAKWVSVETL